jgi:endonuclease-8
MPEGDTVWHTAATLRQHLAGRILTRCDIRVPQFSTVDLTGQVVDEVLSRGKHLLGPTQPCASLGKTWTEPSPVG